MKRQSEIQREKKKSRQEEREEEKARKASYYRKVTGILGDDATNHLGRFPMNVRSKWVWELDYQSPSDDGGLWTASYDIFFA